MNLSRPVIAALDPQRDDSAAARLGLLLARVTGAPLVIASGYAASPHRASADHVEGVRLEALTAVERHRRRLLEAAAGEVEIASTVIAYEASPARAVHRLAARLGASTIVVGASARGHLGRMLPAAMTDRLLHGAPCPVAVAPAGFRGDGLGLIGVAFLERPDGWAALTHGSDLARAAGGLVRVLTVREPSDWRFGGPLEPSQLAAGERGRDDEAERTLSAGLGAIPESRSAGGAVLCGEPHEVLAAASSDLDLLVCGSRGHGPARTLMRGGVSHALVRQAACPVLVVPLADSGSCHGSGLAATADGAGAPAT